MHSTFEGNALYDVQRFVLVSLSFEDMILV